MSSPFKVVSLFAGCGGSSTGYVMAGGKVVLAVEWDDNAVATYRANWPDTPIYHGDVHALTVEKILETTGLEPGELDILDGSPPCQGFSTAGKREFCDPRNQLYNEYIRILRGLRPKVFVMENASGMVKGKMKLIFADILRELKASGYRVSARLVNAMYYGVPQSRQRMIFVGVRDDLGIEPSHPTPQTVPIPLGNVCRDLRGNRPDDRMLPPVLVEVAKYQPDNWNTDETTYRKIKGNISSCFSLKWAGWDRVCGTIIKSEIALTGIVHPDRERYISLAEAKRIATFPDDYFFTDRKHGIERIGNAVPPLLMKAVAEHIRDHILHRDPVLLET